MAQHVAADLSAPHPGGRRLDRERLSVGNHYATGPARSGTAFAGSVRKDVVSRVWRKVKGDWDAGGKRPLAEESIVRLILDGMVVRVRLDRQAALISLLVALGVRADGRSATWETRAGAWRALLDDIVARGPQTQDSLIADDAP